MPTNVVVGWLGIRTIKIEVVRIINIRISGTRPIVTINPHEPQGAITQVGIPATGKTIG